MDRHRKSSLYLLYPSSPHRCRSGSVPRFAPMNSHRSISMVNDIRHLHLVRRVFQAAQGVLETASLFISKFRYMWLRCETRRATARSDSAPSLLPFGLLTFSAEARSILDGHSLSLDLLRYILRLIHDLLWVLASRTKAGRTPMFFFVNYVF